MIRKSSVPEGRGEKDLCGGAFCPATLCRAPAQVCGMSNDTKAVLAAIGGLAALVGLMALAFCLLRYDDKSVPKVCCQHAPSKTLFVRHYLR